MIKIQKRFILSALISGISFIIFYIFLDFYLIISLLLSMLIYIGGIFLFKGKDMRSYDSEAISRYYFEISKLNDYKGVIIFYILLALILMGMGMRNKQIDAHSSNQFSQNYQINY